MQECQISLDAQSSRTIKNCLPGCFARVGEAFEYKVWEDYDEDEEKRGEEADEENEEDENEYQGDEGQED